MQESCNEMEQGMVTHYMVDLVYKMMKVKINVKHAL